MKYILAIDQGTTSTRAILFTHEGVAYQIAQKEVNCSYPASGWVETDALSIWISVLDVITEVTVKGNISFDDIDSIGITNQRETTVIWDKNTGLPVAPAIVWQSRQSASICDSLADKKDFIHKKTGLLINPYFSASKIRFILDHIENGQQRAENGELLFGTIDSWILYKMSKNKLHATDVTNASRTLLFNINDMKWDEELCALFNIPMCMLPEVKPSSYDYGESNFVSNPHIRGIAGDQQAALFGQVCFKKGECKNTYGTGCFMLVNIGETPIFSNSGLITTVAWQIGDKVTYAIEGSVFIGGAAVQWLRDEMKLIKRASDSEACAYASTTEGIYVVPAFTGLGTPYWDDNVRGAVFGLTRATNKNSFVKATLEGIAYQCKDVFEVVKQETGTEIESLKVDGGATNNKFLMQFQSDNLCCDIILPRCLETTALGASYLAGLNSGFYANIDNIIKIHSYQAEYSPKMPKEEVDRRYSGWKKAIEAARLFKNY